ncbi:MAG: hypothetical protein PUB49_08765 [Selenomonadaceae bacterium]|nr:hypothetical protein [Selenomonadaceae bacterium]
MTGEYDADLLWRHNTIEEKMNIASQLLQVELAVIEPLGDVRYKTDALSESVLSLLRNRRQALLQKREKSFPGLMLRALHMKSQSLGWLVVELGRTSDRVRFYVACQAIRIIKRQKF